MSENYTLYTQKMAELRAFREAGRRLRRQIDALFQVVRDCEAGWALDDRADG
jgi:hypothetical protein